jgi:hypothetical protein
MQEGVSMRIMVWGCPQQARPYLKNNLKQKQLGDGGDGASGTVSIYLPSVRPW